MIHLRPGQIEVAQYRGGFMAVPAVPGAGKTTVLAHLAAELISEGRPQPGKILIVTVMNSAVSNFRSRIGDFLVERGLPRTKGYEVKTLHSLAMTILKEKPEFLMINQGFQVLDEMRQWELLEELADRWLGRNRSLWIKPIKVKKEDRWYQGAVDKWEQKDLKGFFREAIGYIKAQGLSPQEVQDMLVELEADSYLRWAMEMYLVYNQELHRNGWLDFDDLIAQALRLLREDDGVRERLGKRWTYIFEDEAQDSNPLQEEILHLLAGEKGNLVRVGDSNQAIMGTFTSAEPEIFRRFCSRGDVQKESILCSSRSTVQVIELANYLVDWTRGQHPQPQCREALENQLINPVGEGDPFPNPTTDGYTVAWRKYPDYDSEVQEVAKWAAQHALKSPENTVAVLVPNRFVQADMAEKLVALGAEFEEVGKISDGQAKTIVDVKVVIDYLAEPQKVDGVLKTLRFVLLPDLSEEAWAALGAVFSQYNLEEVLYPQGGDLAWLKLPEELFEPELWNQFNRALGRLRNWLDASVTIPPDDLVLFLAEDLELEEEQLAIAHNLSLQIKQAVHLNPSWKLLDIARDLPRMEASLRRFVQVLFDYKGFHPKPGVISLITSHKSKGLEWDTVFLMSLTGAEYPSTVKDKFRSECWYLAEDKCNPMAIAKAELKRLLGKGGEERPLEAAKLDEISERLRLFYVAITRAKKNLLLSYYDRDKFKRQVGPSKALIALGEYIKKEQEAYASQRS
ncbi:MAG: ATP-dependent helicase [Clostridia bacterium]|nr:ATP-dependent helicase [Clostridia bacterium]